MTVSPRLSSLGQEQPVPDTGILYTAGTQQMFIEKNESVGMFSLSLYCP